MTENRRYYGFLGKNGRIAEEVLSLEAAIEVAKEWAELQEHEVMVISYPYTTETVLHMLQHGKARNEGVAYQGKFYKAHKGLIVKDGIRWGYILNKNLSPAPYLAGRK